MNTIINKGEIRSSSLIALALFTCSCRAEQDKSHRVHLDEVYAYQDINEDHKSDNSLIAFYPKENVFYLYPKDIDYKNPVHSEFGGRFSIIRMGNIVLVEDLEFLSLAVASGRGRWEIGSFICRRIEANQAGAFTVVCDARESGGKTRYVTDKSGTVVEFSKPCSYPEGCTYKLISNKGINLSTARVDK